MDGLISAIGVWKKLTDFGRMFHNTIKCVWQSQAYSLSSGRESLQGYRLTTRSFWPCLGGPYHDQETMTIKDKTRIVMESLVISVSAVDICRKYGISSDTFHLWREMFLDRG